MEQGRISVRQFSLVMIGFLLSTTLILTPGGGAKQDAWLAIVLGMVEGWIFSIPCFILANRFKTNTLIEICEIIYGKVFGKFAGAVFIWFFFHLASLVLRTFCDFFSIAVMPSTPETVFAILIIFTCAFAIRNGLEPIARVSEIIVPLVIGIALVVSSLMIPEIKLSNFKPMLETPFPKLLWAAHGVATLPFAETAALLMISPFIASKKRLGLFSTGAFIITGMLLIMFSFRIIGTLGITAALFTYPNYQTVRMISLANILSRLEILTAISFLLMGFIKITVLYYGAVIGSSQLFNLNSYKTLIIPMGILLIILQAAEFTTATENFFFAVQIHPIYSLPFEMILPLVTLLTAIFRKLPKQHQALSSSTLNASIKE